MSEDTLRGEVNPVSSFGSSFFMYFFNYIKNSITKNSVKLFERYVIGIDLGASGNDCLPGEQIVD